MHDSCRLAGLGLDAGGITAKGVAGNQTGREIMQRITKGELEKGVMLMNKETGSPLEHRSEDGEPNPNHYHLSGAYGGHNVHRTCADGGGISNVFSCGHVSKRELNIRIEAFLDGTEAVKASSNKPRED